jgi:hypothetical protein
MREAVEIADRFREPGALAVQFLSAIGFVPDIRLREFAFEFVESFRFARVVKDTPSGRRGDLADP